MKHQKGFTLLEILITLSLLGILMVVSSQMFLSILKGSTKSRVLTRVKQEGDFALGVMEQMIRNARIIQENSEGTVCEASMSRLRINGADGHWTEFYFDPANQWIASESSDLIGSEARLTSSDVSLQQGRFNCIAGNDSGPDKVAISFTLTQASGERVEETASVGFQATVFLRNY